MARAGNPNLTFKQDTPSVSWTINHALNKMPVVDVMIFQNGSLVKAIPHLVSYPDLNTIEITFLAVQSGEARLS